MWNASLLRLQAYFISLIHFILYSYLIIQFSCYIYLLVVRKHGNEAYSGKCLYVFYSLLCIVVEPVCNVEVFAENTEQS